MAHAKVSVKRRNRIHNLVVIDGQRQMVLRRSTFRGAAAPAGTMFVRFVGYLRDNNIFSKSTSHRGYVGKGRYESALRDDDIVIREGAVPKLKLFQGINIRPA
jgi:hypothetical protein